MKYKSVVFAVHTDGKKPFIQDELFALSTVAWFEYDTEKMACIVFGIVPETVNEEEIRTIVPFYMGYEIDNEKYIEAFERLANELDYLNGVKERPIIMPLGVLNGNI